ncbi:MAG TPA: glutaredoxin [Polyangiaceae bacterium]
MASIWGFLERMDYTFLRLTRRLPSHATKRAAGPASAAEVALDVSLARARQAVAAPASLGNPQRPAQVFGRSSCLWTGRVTRLLEDRGVEHDSVDLDDPANQAHHVQLVRETKQNESPYVFVRGEFIGGYDALSELDRLGQLAERVAVDVSGKSGPLKSKIVVAARDAADEEE